MNRQTKKWFARLVLIVIGVAVTLSPAVQAKMASVKGVNPGTEIIVDTSMRQWEVSGGFINLFNTCPDGSSQTLAQIKRRPIQSSSNPAIIQGTAGTPACQTYRYAAVDDSGLYYYNKTLGRIEAVYSQSPFSTPTVLANIGVWTKIGSGDGISELKLYGDYVYWMEETINGEFDPSDIEIKRVAKTGGAVVTVISYAGRGVTQDGLGITNRYIWWTDSDGLNRTDRCGVFVICNPNIPAVKVVAYPFFMHSGHLNIRGSNILWWNSTQGSIRSQLRYTSCSFFGSCSTSDLYLAGTGVTITGVVATSSDAYWVELAGSGPRLRRQSLSGGSVATLVENISGDAPAIDNFGIYYRNVDTIFRVGFNSQAITREMSVAGWEVTQGIQRLSNDVPLVSAKTTYVRVYPQIDSGVTAGSVIAYLHGYKNGQELPDSPIYPLNGSIAVKQNQGLENRSILNSGWLYKLPINWTREGNEAIPQIASTLTLKAVIDPWGTYADTDSSANNEIQDQFMFTAKAPTCLNIRSVKTHAPYQSPHTTNVAQALDLMAAVLPTPKLIVQVDFDQLEEVHWCWKAIVYGPFCSTPYELDDDVPWMLAKMTWLDFWASYPSQCASNNARTLYSGVAHDESIWNAGDSSVYGIARRGKDELISKIPKYGSTFDRFNNDAMAFVHEVGHTYGRKHVDCGNPDNPDSNYPYPVCQLDDNLSLNHSELHYGYDPILQEPVVATSTADMMAYASPTWISDYTWKAIFNATRDPVYIPPPQQALGNTDFIVISGLVEPIMDEGVLDFVWHVPTDQLNSVLEAKIQQRMSAPWIAGRGANSYHVQLLGSTSQILADQLVELSELSENEATGYQPFQIALETPVVDVATIQLMNGSTVLYTMSPGATPPVITLQLPAGGENVTDSLTIEWTASDTDQDDLLYTIQYSADQGNSWNPLRVNYGGSEQVSQQITLDVSGLPGSQGMNALIRVMVSDGYHTQFATSQPFSVASKNPSVSITKPDAGEVFAADQTIQLRGFASDAEDSIVSDSQFNWSFGVTGSNVDLNGLAPGLHDILLTVTDNDAQSGDDAIQVKVLPFNMSESASALTLDGSCDDAAYENSHQVQLGTYADGSHPIARIVYNTSYMWICMSELQPGGYAGILADIDHSADNTVQNGDFGYFVRQDGTPIAEEGNGISFDAVSIDALTARIADYGQVWSAELRVRKSTFGDFNRQIGFSIGHFGLAGNAKVSWPVTASKLNASSWGSTNLGMDVQLEAASPVSSLVGSADMTLTVSGSGFSADHQVIWNGAALITTFVTENTLQATVPASMLITIGTVEISLGSSSSSSLDTGSINFDILNPRAQISQLIPDKALFGSPAMNIMVHGTGFIDGAVVLINGDQHLTTFISQTELIVTLEAEDLVAAPVDLSLRVINPDPSVGLSPIKIFQVLTLDQFPIFEDGFE